MSISFDQNNKPSISYSQTDEQDSKNETKEKMIKSVCIAAGCVIDFLTPLPEGTALGKVLRSEFAYKITSNPSAENSQELQDVACQQLLSSGTPLAADSLSSLPVVGELAKQSI